MRDFEADDAIDDAMRAHERELLRSLGEEPGHLAQVASMFDGRSGWINVVLIIAQGLMFVAGALAGWRFFQAVDALEALRWGLPGATLLLGSLMIKLAMWPTLHANRLALQMKRIELQLVQARASTAN